MVIVGFTLIYQLAGAATAMPGCGYAALSVEWRAGCEPTRSLIDNVLFSLGAMTTTDVGAVQAYRSHVGIWMTLEALLGIALTGLTGFVLGK
jgi:hypothetical protein